MTTLYTIGYATKTIEVFLGQLDRYAVDVVADVRSVPYSKAFPDYHQDALAGHLRRSGLRYVYLGNELGPRSTDPGHYDETGQVQFDRVMLSDTFLSGIARLQLGLQKGYSIALMCAEKDPARCHRSLLVSYHLAHSVTGDGGKPVDSILHITHDGMLESQESLEHRLVTVHDLEKDLFLSAEEREKQAYLIQLKETSYRKPEE